MQYLQIAGVGITLEGWRLDGLFAAFEPPSPGRADIRFELVWGDVPVRGTDAPGVEVAPGQLLYRYGGDYVIEYLGDGPVFGMSFTADYARCVCYANRAGYHKLADKEAVLSKNVNVALRRCFSGRLSLEDGLLLHCAGLAWRGGGIAFSGPSGAGKTTQARLWQKHRGARLLDGDSCALRCHDGRPRLYGLPWCGSSGIGKNASAPLEAIVFLEQAAQNTVAALSPHEQALRLLGRCFLPLWDHDDMVGRCLQIAETLLSATRCCLLRCRPEVQAVELLTQWIEQQAEP